MNRQIYDTSILDLLPERLREDPDILAASESVNSQFYETVSLSDSVKILINLEGQPDEVLELLLWQFHITPDEGLSLADSRQEKISLIRNSEYIHAIKGTPYAIEYVLKLLNMRGKVSEWYEYDSKAGYFKIDIQVTTRGLTERNTRMLERLVNAYKRKSAWLEVINFHLASNAKQYMASTMYYGEEITVYPWNKTDIESKGKVTLGTTSQFIETLTTYPD